MAYKLNKYALLEECGERKNKSDFLKANPEAVRLAKNVYQLPSGEIALFIEIEEEGE